MVGWEARTDGVAALPSLGTHQTTDFSLGLQPKPFFLASPLAFFTPG